MDDQPRAEAQPRSTPRPAEIVGYGLLATAVAAGVLYLDGQRPVDIALISGAILALLTTLVLIAPRLGAPDEAGDTHAQRDERQATANTQARRHSRRPRRPRTGPERPAVPTEMTEPEMSQDDNDTESGKPGRRAKRGRRRR